MTRQTFKEAVNYVSSKYVKSGILRQHPANDKHKAFFVASYSFIAGGADKSFEISRATFTQLKATGLFK